MKKVIPLVLCFAIITSGCANIQDDGLRTRTEGTLVGSAAGAGAGALIGKLAGNTLVGALTGGAIGGLIGLAVGNHIADKKADYASQEEWLDACIAQSQEVNAELVAYNDSLRQESAHLDALSTQLAADYKMQKVNESDMKKAYAGLMKKQKEVDDYIAVAEDEIKKQKTVSADAHKENNEREAAIIDHEIVKMEKQIAELREESNKLASMSTRIAL